MRYENLGTRGDGMPPLFAKGITGTITVDEDWLTIDRKGLRATLNQGFKGAKRIPIANITSVQFKEPGLTSGYIQFSLLGSSENKRGFAAAGGDENTVVFKISQRDAMHAIKEHVERYLTDRLQLSRDTPSASDIPAQIRKLAELREDGLITAEEFEAKRLDLLNRM